ncbi:MAG: Asp-tRNA(Asn)/Glu-tRNA(Gln) amidotransferase GatCAB subunit B [Planctomycetes bacterium]|nr:Asp-tRNA(Asn)/Glu-tRNA(Gln) amidotransferase GatCAB subunit B [Planctomycetota bacterium]
MTTSDWELVIGIEVHVQLRTESKMFSPAPNAFGGEPNTRTDPYTLGLPGTLPVANRAAFGLAIRVGLAIDAELARYTTFDRKNYFYPDLPKGYQISQLDHPVVEHGKLPLASGKIIRINRAHLEEDAGKAMHEGGPHSVIDLNRAGIPLLEIVSEPDMRSSAEAVEYLTRLKLLLRYLEVSDCDMEKGSLRCDVNVSIRRSRTEPLGTRCEVKNLNSFKAVEKAIEFEFQRHQRCHAAGEPIVQATLLWDDDKEETRLMRTKEESADYRYFPDPDLPPHHVTETWIDDVRKTMPELPWMREARLAELPGITAYDAGVLIQDRSIADFFEAASVVAGDPKAVANWITGELFGLLREHGDDVRESGITVDGFGRLVALVKDGTVGAAGGKKVLAAMYGRPDADPRALIDELGLGQISDEGALREIVQRALDSNPKTVEDLKAGKKKAAGALVGWVMKETRGSANPGLVNKLIGELTR